MVSYQKRHEFKLCPADEREGLHVEASADGVVVRARVDRRCGDPRSTPVPPDLELGPGEINPIRGALEPLTVGRLPIIRLPSSLRIRPSLPMRAATRPCENQQNQVPHPSSSDQRQTHSILAKTLWLCVNLLFPNSSLQVKSIVWRSLCCTLFFFFIPLPLLVAISTATLHVHGKQKWVLILN